MGEWKFYRKTSTQEMRPYVPGEDLTEISVSPEDTPGPRGGFGGMIARNSENYHDQWYVAAEFFAKNYELA